MERLKQKDIKECRERFVKKQKKICLLCENIMDMPVLDHDHIDGHVRGALCLSCNANGEGRVMSLLNRTKCGGLLSDKIKFLRNLADYLENDYSDNPIHPTHLNAQVKRVLNLSAVEQKKILTDNDIVPGTNQLSRKKQFRTLIKEGKFDI